MKLNKYIYSKLVGVDVGTVTEEDIDDWIADWYTDTFKGLGCHGEMKDKPRGPPMWLCGPRWYDRRKRIIKEAEAEIKKAESKSYELDE